MKRFAAHYLFIPSMGFLAKQVVEVGKHGFAERFFSLTEEIESVEWQPGVIALLTPEQMKSIGLVDITCPMLFSKESFPQSLVSENDFLNYIQQQKEAGKNFVLCLFYPFDFTSMQPVSGTRHKQLL